MPFPDEIEFRKQIFDDVHGFIGITELESKVIASPFFQRLRRIKQLSLLDYVFPGASHTRFSHSLGVMQIADNMIVQLQKDEVLKGKRKLIRMAALLHDIGHYPLSHLVETCVKDDAKAKIKEKEKKDKKILLVEENGEDPIEGTNKLNEINFINSSDAHISNQNLHNNRNNNFDHAHHERIAGIVINKTPLKEILLEDGTFNEDDIRTISQIIAGTYAGPESLIIHSELDADRFDYLLRDSKRTGVNYGLFDMNQIIRNLKYLKDEGKLAVDEKAIKAVEQYLMCRYFFYTTVVYHKATIGFEIMAKKVYEGLMERKMVMSYFDLIKIFDKGELDKYLNYDDSYFFDRLRGISQKKILLEKVEDPKIPDEFLLELIDKIVKREPLKKVLEKSKLVKKITTSRKPENLDFFSNLFKKEVLSKGVKDYWFIESTITESPTKISPYVNFDSENNNYGSEVAEETIRILKTDIDDGIKKKEFLIKDESSIISILGNYNLQIDRLYTKDEEYTKIIEEVYHNSKSNT